MTAASSITTLLLALAIAIAAKPVIERKLPLKLPLNELRTFTNHNDVERDRRLVNSLMMRAGDQDDSASISIKALSVGGPFSVNIGIGNPANSCK